MRTFFLPLVALITGCTATTHQQPALYSQYTRYSETVTAGNIKSQYHLFFTPAPLDGESLDDPEIVSHLLFPRVMSTQSDHFEKTMDKAGCLTINGVSGEDEPMTFSLEYARTIDGWRIDEILMFFFEDSTDLPGEALCPDELKDLHL